MATEPLFGNPAVNAPVWSKYAVLFGSLAATKPVGTAAFTLNDPAAGPPAVTTQWDPIGALDSDNPFDSGAETITATDHSAAGLGIYAASFKDQKEVVTFTAKETRLVTLGILYNTSGLTTTSGNLSGTLALRDPTKTFLAAFHRQNGAGKIERRISHNYAYIDSITRNSGNDESTYTVGVCIVPDSAGLLYDYYLGS